MVEKKFLHEEPLLQSMRCPGAGGLTIHVLKNNIEKACAQYGLNVVVDVDTINSGRLFDKSTTECVTVKNAEHMTDYYTEVVAMKTQGTYAFIDFYFTGNSKNCNRVAEGERKHSTMAGSIIGAIKKATVSNEAMETETNYYSMLCDAISSVFH